MTHPTEPHERAAAGLDESKWLSDEDDDLGHDTQVGSWIGILFLGVLLGLAAFVGIVIGMM